MRPRTQHAGGVLSRSEQAGERAKRRASLQQAQQAKGECAAAAEGADAGLVWKNDARGVHQRQCSAVQCSSSLVQ